MHLRRALIIFCVEACAPRLAAPTSLEVQASTMLVDWDDIPSERCTPPVHGMYMSYQGGADLIEQDDAAARTCARRVLAAETGRKLAEARCTACDADRQWAVWGRIGAGVAAVLTVFVGIFAVRSVTR